MKNRFFNPLLTVILSTSFTAVAATSSKGLGQYVKQDQNSYSLSTTLSVPDKDASKESNLNGDFGIRTNQLVENVGDVPGNQYYGDVNVKYNVYTEGENFYNVDFATRVNDQEEMMFSVKEIFWQKRYSYTRGQNNKKLSRKDSVENTKNKLTSKVSDKKDEALKIDSALTVGRKMLNWSQVDKQWGLGKVNNRVNFDYFEPGQEGLAGIVFDQKLSNGFGFGVFVSGLYIPELNPSSHYDEDEGTVTCKNPWCKAPNQTAPVNDKEVPIYYNINYPDAEEVVFRASAGLNIGQEIDVSGLLRTNSKISLSGFYMRKPENQISTSVEIKYQNDEDRVFVDVTPQVFYHDLRGANAELDIEDYNLKLYGSFLSAVPEKQPDSDDPLIEYIGYKPKKLQEDYISTGLIFNDGDFRGHVGYIARTSEFDRENEVLAEYPRWNQALQLAAQKNLTNKVFVSLDVKYDMLTEDRLTMFNSSYRFGPSMVGSLGVNIIGTNPDEVSYWSDFENNDAVYSSIKYTF